MKERTLTGFGPRLAAPRQARGLSQEALADAAGVSRRVIADYEAERAQPPGALLVELAQALTVFADELLGLKLLRESLPPMTARLLKRLRRIEELPPADQRAVVKLVDAMLETRRRSAPASAKRRRTSCLEPDCVQRARPLDRSLRLVLTQVMSRSVLLCGAPLRRSCGAEQGRFPLADQRLGDGLWARAQSTVFARRAAS